MVEALRTEVGPEGRVHDFRASEPVRTAPKVRSRRRTPILLGVMVAVAVVGMAGYFVWTRGRESTDNAQVEGRVINVAARIAGQVVRVHVQDNQRVDAGDVLVEIDTAELTARAEAAKADLAAVRALVDSARASLLLTETVAPASLVQAEGGLTEATSSLASARSAIEQTKTDVAAARARRNLAALNLQRASILLRGGAAPRAEVEARRTEFDAAHAALELARARLSAAKSGLTGSGGTVTLAKGRLSAAEGAGAQVAAARAALAVAEARVGQAESAVKLATISLSYATVRAPRGGIVSRRTVEEGQTAVPDRPLLSIIPRDDLWIVANFKEDQVAAMQPGQPVSVRLDTYGSRAFVGYVDSIAAATGARFALLPPDNATGNFIKVVQRIPVIIRLQSVHSAILRPGMSAAVAVDTRTHDRK